MMKNFKFNHLALVATLFSHAAIAGVADYVYIPAVEYGEKEIDFKTGSAKLKSADRAQVSSIGFGYGISEYWFSEIYFKHEREGSETISIGEWENKFQLTETGKYPADLGLVVEIEAPLNKNTAYELKLAPLLQTEFGKIQLNGNIILERTFGPGDHITELGYQWQAKYRLQPTFELGLQGFGDLGKWNDWAPADEQNHRLGPAIFGKFDLGTKKAIKYNAALLFGTSEAAANNTFRMQLEYEF
jgi:hypothetical protein